MNDIVQPLVIQRATKRYSSRKKSINISGGYFTSARELAENNKAENKVPCENFNTFVAEMSRQRDPSRRQFRLLIYKRKRLKLIRKIEKKKKWSVV